MFKDILRKFGRVLTRLAASLGALLAAGGLAVVGLVLMLAGVLVVQQTLSRFVGLGVRLGDVLTWTGRIFMLMGRAAGAEAAEVT